MFASLLLAAVALAQIVPLVIPFGKPRQIVQPRAPIESAGPEWARACKGSDDWDKPAPPVRIHGNTYYVGTCGISAILDHRQGRPCPDRRRHRARRRPHRRQYPGAWLPAVGHPLHPHQPRPLRPCRRHREAAADQRCPCGDVHPRRPRACDGHPARRRSAIWHDQAVSAGPGRPQGRRRRGGADRRPDADRNGDARPYAGAMSWRWVSCDGGVCRMIVYADSLTAASNDKYRFSDHPEGARRVPGVDRQDRCQPVRDPRSPRIRRRANWASGSQPASRCSMRARARPMRPNGRNNWMKGSTRKLRAGSRPRNELAGDHPRLARAGGAGRRPRICLPAPRRAAGAGRRRARSRQARRVADPRLFRAPPRRLRTSTGWPSLAAARRRSSNWAKTIG